jgi:Mg-chelatase subunit ChlD
MRRILLSVPGSSPWLIGCLLLTALTHAPAWPADRERLDVVVVLDNSGSMHREGGAPGNDERFMRVTALQYLLEKMGPGDRAALVTFDTKAHADPEASRLRDVAEAGMKEAFYRGTRRIAAAPNGSTNVAAGLRAAAAILRRGDGETGRRGRSSRRGAGRSEPGAGGAGPSVSHRVAPSPKAPRRRFLILLTDGTPNPPHGENTPAAILQYMALLGHEGIVVHTVGLGELSPRPSESAAARRLLEAMARAGKGASHVARSAEDLPALFGLIFAQLVGHEVTRPVEPGRTATVTLSPGTHNLRVLATHDGAAPQLTLTDPRGRAYPARAVPPLLPGQQTAWIAAASVNEPIEGTWTVRAARGALEVAWEPSFEAVLVAPRHNNPAPSRAPLRFTVEVRRKGGSAPLKLTQGRVQVEYETAPGRPPAQVWLTEDLAAPGRFSGPENGLDSGTVGPHNVRVRCFRAGENGEEEGGPAYAVLQVGRLPLLEAVTPAPGASYTLPEAVPVRARLRVAGAPWRGRAESMRLQAVLLGQKGPAASRDLAPQADGTFVGQVPPGGQPGAAVLRLTLSGRFEGAELEPQTVTLPLTLVPRPVVALRWVGPATRAANPDDEWALVARVHSSAPSPQEVRLSVAGLPHASFDPPALTVAANQPDRDVPLRLRWRGAAPGDHQVTVVAALLPARGSGAPMGGARARFPREQSEAETSRAGREARGGGGPGFPPSSELRAPSASGASLEATPFAARLHVRDWLERNRGWFYPLIALVLLLALVTIAAVMAWMREQARRQRKMRDVLNGVAVYVPGTAQGFRPEGQKALVRRSFTFGGPGADVLLADPAQPGQLLFREPRLRVAVEWDGRARQPRLRMSPEGTDTMLYDREGQLIGEPIVPTEGGALFYVDPEHVLVRVSSEWTA